MAVCDTLPLDTSGTSKAARLQQVPQNWTELNWNFIGNQSFRFIWILIWLFWNCTDCKLQGSQKLSNNRNILPYTDIIYCCNTNIVLLNFFSARTSSVQTFDSLDFARYSDDGERQVDERVAGLCTLFWNNQRLEPWLVYHCSSKTVFLRAIVT
jgi:hypothetical protein